MSAFGGRLLDLPACEIEACARLEGIERRVAMVGTVRDPHHAFADHCHGVALHYHRRALVYADAKQAWMGGDHDRQVALAATLGYVLIDRYIGEVAEATLISRCHQDLVRLRRSADQVGALDRCARRSARDQAISIENSTQLGFSASAFIGIDQTPLASPRQ